MLTHAFLRKKQVGNNPWGEGATTLEWTLSSPPPFHQFDQLPKIPQNPKTPERYCYNYNERNKFQFVKLY